MVKLVRDYRSTPQVVALANGVLARAGGLARSARLELIAQRPAGPDPSFTSYADDVAEATGVATAAAKLVAGGTRPSEIAVLFRTNAQSEPLEQALAEAGVPYLVRGGERFFARREVRDAIVLLRGAARAADPAQPLGEATRDALASAGWTAEAPSGSGAVRERWESLQALAALADELVAARPGATLSELVTELDERSAAQHAPTVEGVTLASLHAAKGPGVGRRLPGRADRGAAADQLRRGRDGGRGGAPAALRRGHPGPRAPRPVLVSRPHAGWPGDPQALAVPRRAAPAGSRSGRKPFCCNGIRWPTEPWPAHADDLPHVWQDSLDGCRAQDRPVLELPADL